MISRKTLLPKQMLWLNRWLKHLSIKRGKALKIEEQQQLINDLFACKEAQLSPFNRQIFVSLTKEELEKKFS